MMSADQIDRCKKLNKVLEYLSDNQIEIGPDKKQMEMALIFAEIDPNQDPEVWGLPWGSFKALFSSPWHIQEYKKELRCGAKIPNYICLEKAEDQFDLAKYSRYESYTNGKLTFTPTDYHVGDGKGYVVFESNSPAFNKKHLVENYELSIDELNFCPGAILSLECRYDFPVMKCIIKENGGLSAGKGTIAQNKQVVSQLNILLKGGIYNLEDENISKKLILRLVKTEDPGKRSQIIIKLLIREIMMLALLHPEDGIDLFTKLLADGNESALKVFNSTGGARKEIMDSSLEDNKIIISDDVTIKTQKVIEASNDIQGKAVLKNTESFLKALRKVQEKSGTKYSGYIKIYSLDLTAFSQIASPSMIGYLIQESGKPEWNIGTQNALSYLKNQKLLIRQILTDSSALSFHHKKKLLASMTPNEQYRYFESIDNRDDVSAQEKEFVVKLVSQQSTQTSKRLVNGVIEWDRDGSYDKVSRMIFDSKDETIRATAILVLLDVLQRIQGPKRFYLKRNTQQLFKIAFNDKSGIVRAAAKKVLLETKLIKSEDFLKFIEEKLVEFSSRKTEENFFPISNDEFRKTTLLFKELDQSKHLTSKIISEKIAVNHTPWDPHLDLLSTFPKSVDLVIKFFDENGVYYERDSKKHIYLGMPLLIDIMISNSNPLLEDKLNELRKGLMQHLIERPEVKNEEEANKIIEKEDRSNDTVVKSVRKIDFYLKNKNLYQTLIRELDNDTSWGTSLKNIEKQWGNSHFVLRVASSHPNYWVRKNTWDVLTSGNFRENAKRAFIGKEGIIVSKIVDFLDHFRIDASVYIGANLVNIEDALENPKIPNKYFKKYLQILFED